jgi:2,4-dienoyl-CoA reductase (NADPH2)
VLLAEPVALGPVQVRNRLLFGPHATNLAVRRAVSERHVAYYARRARGGAGVIVTEEASVHPLDWPYERAPLAADSVPGWAAVAAACRAEGAVVVAALGHSGLQGSSAFSQRETWAPSRVADAVTREPPKEMEPEDVEAVLDGFAAAARAAVLEAGLDGVEVNAGQHSLVRQFLSGLTNTRGDEWGPGEDGTGRLRFATEVLNRARVAIGPDAVLGLRLSCDELAPWAGLTPELAGPVAAALAPLVDYLVVVRGSIYSTDATTPDCHHPAGFNADLARLVAAAVGDVTAVVAQGSIVDPAMAEELVADGSIRMIEMTRAQIADPDLGGKLAAGTPERVRPCLRCNQRCRVRDNRNPIVSCTVHPTAGYELTEPEGPAEDGVAPGAPSGGPHTVRVVGAGPAGLELARIAARTGHDVHVHDRRDRPGGIVADWAVAAGRDGLGALVPWLAAECERSGVSLHLGAEVTVEDVASWEDAGATVVLCTGARAADAVPYEVEAGGTVTTALGAIGSLAAGGPLPGPVVVWDPVGGPVGISVAESLAPTAAVSLVTPDLVAGTLLSLTGDLAAASTRLHQAGVAIVRRHRLRAVRAGSVTVEDVHTGATATLDAATVVDAGHRVPDDALWQATRGRLRRAGDAVAPRTIYEAVLEGRRVALALDLPVPAHAGVGHR